MYQFPQRGGVLDKVKSGRYSGRITTELTVTNNTEHEGLSIGHAMAEVAADNAGAEWKAAAFYAFKRHAMKHLHFTTEEVRAANPDIPPPPDDRAWGSIALKAKREKIVIGSGWVRANSRTVHGMVVTKWYSTVYSPEMHDGSNPRVQGQGQDQSLVQAT